MKNAILDTAIIQQMNPNKYLVMIDFSKAFDKISHEFIMKTLEKMNFGPKFIKLIASTLNGKNRIKIKNDLTEEFDIQRGVPQGDVTSPFLFIFVINSLLNMIDKEKSIKGIKTGNTMIKFSAYAN